MWGRIGPAAGIVGWLVALGGYAGHGYPARDASGQTLAHWASATDPNRFAVGIYVEAVGILIILVFYAWLFNVIRHGERPAWLPMFGFAMVIVWGAAGIFSNSAWTGLLDTGRRGADPQLLAALRDVAQDSFNATYLFFGLGMVALALATVGTRILPAWLSWPALVIGVGLTIPATVSFAGLLVILWAFAVAVLYIVRPPRTSASR